MGLPEDERALLMDLANCALQSGCLRFDQDPEALLECALEACPRQAQACLGE